LLHLSREIGFAQQALVAHPTDGLEGCDRLRTSATAFSALSKHNSVIKTFLVLFDIADFPISHRSLKAIMPLNAPESRPQSFDNPDWGVGAPSSLKRTSGSYWRSYRRFIELTPFRGLTRSWRFLSRIARRSLASLATIPTSTEVDNSSDIPRMSSWSGAKASILIVSREAMVCLIRASANALPSATPTARRCPSSRASTSAARRRSGVRCSPPDPSGFPTDPVLPG
jgi:hypothetical protein